MGTEMRVALFSIKPYDKEFLEKANHDQRHELTFFETHLSPQTTRLAEGFPAVSVFVNDQLNGEVLLKLFAEGTRMVALRCAGYNNVDLSAAEQLGITVARVPAYSPNSISEYTVGLILSLTRNMHRAFNRTRDGNFSLDGLMGFDTYGKTVGVIGTGKIGTLTAKTLRGFDCEVLAYDVAKNPELEQFEIRYVSLEEIFKRSDIITLHCPLLSETHHLINRQSISQMKEEVVIVNTSRGGLINTEDVIAALKTGKIRGLGLDVYEEEEGIFYEDFSSKVIQDDVLARMLTFPNVIISSHQAFFTVEAMRAISDTTIKNLTAFERGEQPPGLIHIQMVRPSRESSKVFTKTV